MTTTEGSNLTLSCNATGNPVPTISWSRDGSLVNTGGRISFLDDKKQLIITNVDRTDSGKYRCVVENSVGNDTSDAATLNVQCKFNISLFFSSTKQLEYCRLAQNTQLSGLMYQHIFCMVYKTTPQKHAVESLKVIFLPKTLTTFVRYYPALDFNDKG